MKRDAIDTTTMPGSSLYEACVGFMVSEKTGTDSWEQVAKWVAEKVANGTPYDHIKSAFEVTEKQIKADFKVATLPVAWRSAKSTALKAARKGVPLVDVDGKVAGKTAIAVATTGTVPRNIVLDLARHIEEAQRLIPHLPAPLAHSDWAALTEKAAVLTGLIHGVSHA